MAAGVTGRLWRVEDFGSPLGSLRPAEGGKSGMRDEDIGFLLGLLGAIAVLLLLISVRVGNIASRLKERFPTAKEEDFRWSQEDPAGHYEAHKNDRDSK